MEESPQISNPLREVEESLQLLLLNRIRRLIKNQDSMEDPEIDRKLQIIEHTLDCIERVRHLC